MKASLTWMNEYVPVDMNRPAQELADELTQAGIPVEEVETVDPGLKKIFTGKITEITKHPDADKLQVCQVACLDTDGTPITKQIITAATNVRVGQIVPVAYHKSRLADGTEIKKESFAGCRRKGCSVLWQNWEFPRNWWYRKKRKVFTFYRPIHRLAWIFAMYS